MISSEDSLCARIMPAFVDLSLTFFPFYVVSFIFMIFGSAQGLVTRPDLMLLVAVLFTEGWWRLRSYSHIAEREKRAAELFGILGAIFSSIVASLHILNELQKLSGVSINGINSTVMVVQGVLFLVGVLYGVYARVMSRPMPNQARQPDAH